ncbi:hypothetical protein D3C77_330390 [compost metagenome]
MRVRHCLPFQKSVAGERRLAECSLSAMRPRTRPRQSSTMMKANGRAAISVMDCSAASPPVLIRVPAVTPSSRAQNRRCQMGEPSLPWVAMLSMTKAPESAEVTKKTLMRITASAEVMSAPGKRSKKLNSRVSMLPTESIRVWPPSCWLAQMAALPNTVIHSRLKAVGTNRTPRMNSRRVRPREMRAMKRPTKGDQEIHQAQ